MNKNLHLEMKMVLKTFYYLESTFISLLIRSIKNHKGLEKALGLSPESGLYEFKLKKGFSQAENLRILDLWKEKPNLFLKNIISEGDNLLQKSEKMTKEVFEFIHTERHKVEKKKEEAERKKIIRKYNIQSWSKAFYEVKECACCKNKVSAVFYDWGWGDGLVYNCSACNSTIREKSNGKTVKLPIPNNYNKNLDNEVKYGTEKTYVKKEYQPRIINPLSNYGSLEVLENNTVRNSTCKCCGYPVKSVELFGKTQYASCEFCGVFTYEDGGYTHTTPHCVSEIVEYAIKKGIVKN